MPKKANMKAVQKKKKIVASDMDKGPAGTSVCADCFTVFHTLAVKLGILWTQDKTKDKTHG